MIKLQLLPAVTMTIILTIFTGICFPLIVWGFSQLLVEAQANGSLIENGGKIIGSQIIGQNFTSPRYFHPRPSAAGGGYDPLASSGTNLGPTSSKLFEGITDDHGTTDSDESYSGVKQLAAAYRELNELPDSTLVPVDAVTRSASGLDPHISLLNAKLQANRVAKERAVPLPQIESLIEKNTEGRFLGIFGAPRVNVLMLNLAVDAHS